LLAWPEQSDFFTAPASTKYHGNYEGGLCDHSIGVYERLVRLNEIYEARVEPESAAIAALFHDVCKIDFYKRRTRNVKNENGVWITKEVWEVDEKIPLGHGEKSCLLLKNYIRLTFLHSGLPVGT
jgi:HD superfamily phosphohydrolase YqeK